jgi:hypothetical protein
MFKQQKFPILRWYKDGLFVKEYSLSRESSEIVKWATKQTEPVVHMTRSKDELDAFTRGRHKAAIVFFGSNEMPEYRAFWGTASTVIDATFVLNTDLDVAKTLHLKQPSIMAFRRDDPPVLFGGNLSNPSEIKKFSVRESIPLVFELDQSYNRPIF